MVSCWQELNVLSSIVRNIVGYIIEVVGTCIGAKKKEREREEKNVYINRLLRKRRAGCK